MFNVLYPFANCLSYQVARKPTLVTDRSGSESGNHRKQNRNPSLISALGWSRFCSTSFLDRLANTFRARFWFGSVIYTTNHVVFLAGGQSVEANRGLAAAESRGQILRNFDVAAIQYRNQHKNPIALVEVGVFTNLLSYANVMFPTANRKKADFEWCRIIDARHDQDSAFRPQRLGDFGWNRNGTVIHAFRPILQCRLEG
jgi:hypothetical protein